MKEIIYKDLIHDTSVIITPQTIKIKIFNEKRNEEIIGVFDINVFWDQIRDALIKGVYTSPGLKRRQREALAAKLEGHKED